VESGGARCAYHRRGERHGLVHGADVAQEGAKVALVDRSSDAVESVAQDNRNAGSSISEADREVSARCLIEASGWDWGTM